MARERNERKKAAGATRRAKIYNKHLEELDHDKLAL